MKKHFRKAVSLLLCFAIVLGMGVNCIALTVEDNCSPLDSEDTSEYTLYSSNSTGTIGNLTWSVYKNGLLEISGSGAIPEYSSTGSPWYSYRSSITRILVRDTVTEIGVNAFYGFSNLQSVTLPFVGKSRTAVGPEATFGYIFGYTTNIALLTPTDYDYDELYKVPIYRGNTRTLAGYIYMSSSYGNNYRSSNYAYDALGFYSVGYPFYIATSSSSYGARTVFYDFRVMSKTRFIFSSSDPSDTTWQYTCHDYLHYYYPAFYAMQSYYYYIPQTLTKVTITDASKIETAAFNNCKNITKIVLNDGITSIGDYAFQDSGIKDFAIPESISAIGKYLFYGCTGLTEISIPNKIETIGAYAFSGCSNVNAISIPDSVTSMGIGAFSGCTSATTLSFGSGLKTLPDSAFYNCSGISKLVIPDKIETIGAYAFSGCSNVNAISIPDSVTSIGNYAFNGCTSATTLSIGSGLKTLPIYAFNNCSGISKLVIPDKIETIGAYAFSGCSNVNAISIPDSVTSMGTGAFSGCTSATTLSIGSGLKGLPTYAFRNCTGFTSVTVPKTITIIGDAAFYGCNNITDITLPFVGKSRTATGVEATFGNIFGSTQEMVTDKTSSGTFSCNLYSSNSSDSIFSQSYTVGTSDSYNDTAFINGLSNYDPSDWNEPWYTCCDGGLNGYYGQIVTRTFYVPTGLKTVTITDASKIETAAFNNCKNITKIILNKGITSIGDYAFNNCSGISTLVISDKTETIGAYAFSGCTNLKSMTIPRSVIKIGGNAIPDACTICVCCPSAGYDYRSTNRIVLNKYFTSGNETYDYIVNDDGCAEIIGCITTSTELTVPTDFDGIAVNKIGDYGFANCTTLNSITIPANILSIGEYAFDGCTGLVNATIPTTVDTVGDYAFNNCTGLVNVTISEGVQALGEGAFYNCTSLIEAVVPDTAKYVGSYAFYNCTSMVTATIGTTAEGIGDYTFYNCEKLENIVVGFSVKTIGDYAFYNCSLGRVSIPSATVSIGDYAFAENDQMTKATLRKNLLTIGNGAFRNCSTLATVSIPSTVTSIGIEAFENCSSISAITIPVGVTEINNRAFSNCSSLASVTINGEVTRIGISAFYNNAFESITLPETVAVLDDSAFRHCINLKEITLPTSVTTLGGAVFLECSALGNASMPDSVTSVGNGVFFYNDDITVQIRKNTGTLADGILEQQGVHHVILDADISAIGNNAFDSCHELSTITYGEETVNPGEYKFSAAVKSIGSEAFKDNPLLCNLIVPDTLETIGENAFYNVIQSIYNCKDVTVTFYRVNGAISANILKSQNIWHVFVGDGISTVGTNAFNNCKVLKTVSLPDTVSSVGDEVFAESNGDVGLIFRGVDGTIDASVCDGRLNGVAHLIIDEDVNDVASNAFSNNPLLVDLIMSDVITIGDYAFYNDIAINRVTIESQLYRIGNHAFDSCKSIPTVVLPETVREIGSHAFYDCNSMTSINVPTGVAAIKEYTFFGCASLTGIDIPNTVVSIGDYAYYGCVVAQYFNLSNAVESIGAYTFYNCNQVKEINLPNTLKSIGNYSFRSCSSITEISIPDSVTEFGDSVFYACTGLEQAEFGIGITRIGNSEFYGCVQFKKLMLNGDVEYIHDLAFYGAEDAVIYSFENQYVEDYCNDNGLEYHELANDFTMTLTPPVKTEYLELEELGLTGLALNVTYTTGGERTITTGYTVSGYDPTVLGTQIITVTYRGVSQTFDVTVLPKEVSFITATPKTAMSSIVGEELDMSNVIITVSFVDGTSKIIDSGYTLGGFEKETIGDQTVTLTYRDKNCTFNVTVIDYIPGDINGDGIVNIKDITRLVNYLNDNSAYEVINKALDVNGDGVVSIKDVTRLEAYLNDNTVPIY